MLGTSAGKTKTCTQNPKPGREINASHSALAVEEKPAIGKNLVFSLMILQGAYDSVEICVSYVDDRSVMCMCLPAKAERRGLTGNSFQQSTVSKAVQMAVFAFS